MAEEIIEQTQPEGTQTPNEKVVAEEKPVVVVNKDEAEEGGSLLGDSEEEKVEDTPKVPEAYDFKLPEGMELNVDLVEGISPVLKELGLDNEKAQKLVDAYAPIAKAQAEAQEKANVEVWNKQVADWEGETKKALGADYKKELSYAAKFLNSLPNGDKVRQALSDSGFGNHPELNVAFVAAGKAISNDAFSDPNSLKTTPSAVGMDALQYPSMQKK